MKNDAETRKKVQRHDIMQIVARDDRGEAGTLIAVSEVASWGVIAYSLCPGLRQSYRQTWDRIEPTGGRVVIDDNGQPVGPAAPAVKHHP